MSTQDFPENKWLVIVNPNAGKKKGEKDWPQISNLLNEAGLEHAAFFTDHRGHAKELAEEKITGGSRKILMVGGDGTLNEVVNGVFSQSACKTTDVTLGMIMVGTGNDWGRMYDLNVDYPEAIQALLQNRTFIQDCCMVSYSEGSGEQNRYCVNMAGMGYDALVAQMTNQTKERGGGGTMSYLVNLLKGLFSYHHANLEIIVDGQKVYSGRVFSMNVGVCRFNGGGMMQLPFAVPDDGLLDVTIFKNVTKITVIRNLKRLYAGTFTTLPFVQTHRGKTISVGSLTSHKSNLEIDGESMGHTPFRFEIVPKSVKLITGHNWKGINPPDNKAPTDD